MLEQHLALVFVHAVQRRGEHQFAARQEQAKEDLIGQRGTLDVAGAQPETHSGGIGGNQAQAVPARHKAIAPGTLDQPVVEGNVVPIGACPLNWTTPFSPRAAANESQCIDATKSRFESEPKPEQNQGSTNTTPAPVLGLRTVTYCTETRGPPGRIELRMRKRRPKPYPWLKIPRGQARRKIERLGRAWETK